MEMFPDGVVPHTNTGDLKMALAVYGLEPARHLVPFRSTKYRDLEDNAILKVNGIGLALCIASDSAREIAEAREYPG